MNTSSEAKFQTGSPASPQSGFADSFPWNLINSTRLFMLIVATLLLFAYQNREEYLWSAEYGLGYAFGVVGGVFMLLLLLYPLRKKSNKLSLFLGVKQWFKLHMLLGILGPALILLHSNFHLGSTNSSVALVAMLLMVSSGLIGRFLYSKIHRGLYGSKIRLQEILQEKKALLKRINDAYPGQSKRQTIDEILQLLSRYEQAALRPTSIVGNFLRTAKFSISTRHLSRHIKKKVNALASGKSPASKPISASGVDTATKFQQLTKDYMRCIRRTAELGFYEKFFAIWHLLHLPIFGLLIVTALFHVYAVHSY